MFWEPNWQNDRQIFIFFPKITHLIDHFTINYRSFQSAPDHSSLILILADKLINLKWANTGRHPRVLVSLGARQGGVLPKDNKHHKWLRRILYDVHASHSETVQKNTKPRNSFTRVHGGNWIIDMTRLNPTAPQAAVVANEAVYVNSTVVSKHFKTSAITYDLFNKPETGRLVHKMTLPVILAATSGPQSWEVTTSLSPLDQQVSSPV